MIDLGATRGDLQPDWVSRFESGRGNAFARLPTRRPFVMRGQIRRRVQTQTGDDRVGVAIARVDRDPLAMTAFTVLAKFGRADRRFQQTGRAERVGNCSRAIVAPIKERFVTAAENVRFSKKLICRPDCAFYRERSRRGRKGLAMLKTSAISRHGRTGRREE